MNTLGQEILKQLARLERKLLIVEGKLDKVLADQRQSEDTAFLAQPVEVKQSKPTKKRKGHKGKRIPVHSKTRELLAEHELTKNTAYYYGYALDRILANPDGLREAIAMRNKSIPWTEICPYIHKKHAGYPDGATGVSGFVTAAKRVGLVENKNGKLIINEDMLK